MNFFARFSVIGFLTLTALSAWAQAKPDMGPNPAAQSAADALRTFTSADIAFIHAGFLKDTYNKDDLSSWLNYPTDEVVVLELTGDAVRQAFELSVSLFPEPNKSFLQISGAEVSFRKGSPSNSRIASITVDGTAIVGSKTYTVAMPSILAHGAVGYFRIWGKIKPSKTFPNKTMEDVLKGKKATEVNVRWTAVGSFLALLCFATLASAQTPAKPVHPKFDASRAWKDLVKQVDFGPRVPGTEAQIKCRDWMRTELEKSCDKVELQPFSHTWTHSNKLLKMWNVIGFQNWEKASVRVAIIAHWDSRAEADKDKPENYWKPIPGANDGASGVAVITELARVLHETKPNVGVMYVLTDGEDLGPGEDEMYLGAIEFAKHQPLPKADYGILLDMIGSKTLRVPIERNSLEIAGDLVVSLYRHAASVGLADTFPLEEKYYIDDDHLPITKEGLKTIDLIDFDYQPFWHSLADTPDKCSPASLGKVGKLLQTWLELTPAYKISH